MKATSKNIALVAYRIGLRGGKPFKGKEIDAVAKEMGVTYRSVYRYQKILLEQIKPQEEYL